VTQEPGVPFSLKTGEDVNVATVLASSSQTIFDPRTSSSPRAFSFYSSILKKYKPQSSDEGSGSKEEPDHEQDKGDTIFVD
jgi:hypothetical protein